MEKVQITQSIKKCFSCKKQREDVNSLYCNNCLADVEKGKKVNMAVITNGGLVADGLSRDSLKDYGIKNNKTVIEGSDGLVRVMERKEEEK